jgi:hypothetical protein
MLSVMTQSWGSGNPQYVTFGRVIKHLLINTLTLMFGASSYGITQRCFLCCWDKHLCARHMLDFNPEDDESLYCVVY